MIPVIQTDRVRAMNWWNALNIGEKWYYTPLGRHPGDLTGREIQIIWNNNKILFNDSQGRDSNQSDQKAI